MKKIGRNDPCHCGSGKKFKKCCESKLLSGRFLAKPLSETSLQGRIQNLGSLFQARMIDSQRFQSALTQTLEIETKSEEKTETLESKDDILVSS